MKRREIGPIIFLFNFKVVYVIMSVDRKNIDLTLLLYLLAIIR